MNGLDRGTRFVLALVLVAFAGGLTEYLVHLNRKQAVREERAEAVEQLATLGARIEGEVFSTLHLVRGLLRYAAINPDLNRNEFEGMADQVIASGKHIRNIALAPDNVIRFMHPMAGNERAIGLDYTQNAQQWPAVKRAIELGNTIVAGPVELVQGGLGLIARIPIYEQRRNASVGTPLHYWGLASIVIDFPSMLKGAGVAERMGDLAIAIRGKDGLGENGDMVFGRDDMFERDSAVLKTVSLPNGTWQIAALPEDGWGSRAGDDTTVRLMGWVFALGLGVLMWLFAGGTTQRRQEN